MNRLKPSEVRNFREKLLNEQECKCGVCGLHVDISNAVLDHDHKTGLIRGVLHRGCNALLGKIENNYKRLAVPNLQAFLGGLMAYINAKPLTVFHPTYRTEDEKRISRNKRARKQRKQKKGYTKS
jgi:hypothetical protein